MHRLTPAEFFLGAALAFLMGTGMGLSLGSLWWR